MIRTRRPLGPGPQPAARPQLALPAEPRARVMATQADLHTGGLDQMQLPDLNELRARGVLLGDQALGD
ncbi:hypothetical protein [Streptomyces violascens]|uniref:hypothetical protein n=1 Tax=Streptomyces violascens TaxID=67381 RepID=UPI001676F3F7|nr:hypothetical protein [Streptomyces violascens]GGU41026.1 hypothetical protein GCM10010289_72410 [Streptomyces violascens]